MSELRIQTARLELRAATVETARHAIHRAQLSAALDARIPGSWPPDIQRDTLLDDMQRLSVDPGLSGWRHWFFVANIAESPRVLIGGGGFQGPPNGNEVELAYAILPAYQRQGFASEAVAALVDWALGHSQVQRVWAATDSTNAASQRVLIKNGFAYLGAGTDGHLRYARDCGNARPVTSI